MTLIYHLYKHQQNLHSLKFLYFFKIYALHMYTIDAMGPLYC